MSEIMKVDTVQQYNDYFGVETLHPLVSVIEGSKGKPLRFGKKLYNIYAILLKDANCGNLKYGKREYKVTTKKRNAERYSDRIELQGFQSCFRLFVKPSQSPLKPNQDAATLLVRNHARNGDKRTRITKQGVKD